MKTVTTRHIVGWGVTAVGVVMLFATAGVSREPDRTSEAVAEPTRPMTPRSKAVEDLDLGGLQRNPTAEINEHLFAIPVTAASRAAAVVPATPPAPPAASPSLQAPPLPFKYLGRLSDAGTTSVFVAFGNQNLALKEGDLVDTRYRVERIADPGIDFIYLPLVQRQTLTLGARP